MATDDDEQLAQARAIVQLWLDTNEKGANAYPCFSALRDLAVLFRLNRRELRPMNMILDVRLTPAAFSDGADERLLEQLAAGTCAKAPGKWRVMKRGEDLPDGEVRRFMFELEPLDAVARATAANQML